MKHHYTPEQMQAAIDAACDKVSKDHPETCGSLAIHSAAFSSSWQKETPARLRLIKTALALLPEPPPPVVDGKTPGQVNFEASEERYANSLAERPQRWESLSDLCKAEWEAGASAVLAAFGGSDTLDWKAKYETALTALEISKACYEKAEAELDSLKEENAKMEAVITKWSQRQPHLPTLRPISEAGQVPDGCVRVYVLINMEGYVINPVMTAPTHFADIRMPASQASAAESLKDTYQFDGLPEIAQPWTPKVGDVVQLRSGGPKMTVFGFGEIIEATWFDGSQKLIGYFPTATLQPA